MTSRLPHFRTDLSRPALVFLTATVPLLSACSESGGQNPGGTGGNSPGTGAVSGTGGDGSGAGASSSGGAPATGGSQSTGGSGAVGVGGVVIGSGGSLGGGGNVECAGTLPSAVVDGASHIVTVDPVQSWGALPHFWDTLGTGHLGLFLREDRGWGETLMRHTQDAVDNLGMKRIRSHGMFHDDIGIYSEDAEGNPVYSWENWDEIMDFLVGLGIRPIVELAPMPSALAADPSRTVFDWGMGISPPKDYDKWRELVRAFVQHSIDKYGTEVVSGWDFEVWNEPECCSNKFWAGTLEDYHRLYDYSAAGVQDALPGGRVGGPVASQPVELTENSQSGKLFLDHVTTDNFLNPGSPGTLGFFTFHTWSFLDSIAGYFHGLDLLDSYGLTNTPIAVTEFGPTWEFNLYDEPQEMHQGAAFVVQSFADISRRCALEGRRLPMAYSWWVLSDIFEEEQYREDEPFIGCMGLTSREDLHKPAYNAYKFLSQMGTEQVAVGIESPGFVGGMATRDANNGVQLIIYNGQNPGQGFRDDTYYAETEAHEIGVTVLGLNPETAYDVTSYRIDHERGNAYAVWQAKGRPAMPDMSETDWNDLRSAMDSPAEPIGQALCGSSFSQTFSLTSPGVLFVTLTPSQP